MMLSFPRVFQALGLLFVLAGCATAPPSAPPAAAASSPGEPRAEAGRHYRVDAQASQVRILVFRGGAAARLGHNHVLAVPDLTGYVHLPEKGLDGGRFELSFRLDALQVDPPALRQALGPGFASAVTPNAVEATRTNMLGEAGLQADRFPTVWIRSLGLSGELPKLAAQVEIELHGQRQAAWLPLTVTVSDAQLKASGALVIRQSDFGLKPLSVLGGLLAVRDELVVEFELVAR